MAPYTPTITVEAALGYGALATSVSWVSLASGALDYSSTRGRSSEFDYYPAASMGVTLKDTDRRYDPLYSGGTYAGSLLPNVPIRVTATVSGTVYPRFYGYVDSWDVDPRRNIGFTTVTATDGFKILAQKTLPQSVYESVVVADSPHFYWRLGEADGSVAADSSGNANDGVYRATSVTRGDSPLVSYANDGSVQSLVGLNSGEPIVVSVDANARLTSLPVSVEMWIKAPAALSGPITYDLFYQGDASSLNNCIDVRYRVDSSGNHFVNATAEVATTDNFEWSVPSPNVDNLQRHHLVVVLESSTFTAYWDGDPMPVSSSGASSNALTNTNRVWVGGLPLTTANSIADSWLGWVDDVSFYDVALTSAQVSAHYTAGTAPWNGDTTGTRIGRILDVVGWPSGLRDIDSGEVALGPADLAGMNALAYLQLIALSEGGRLFMSNDGKVTFHDAAAVRADTAVEATFSDDGSDNPYLYGSLKYSKSDRFVYNEASVQRKYGLPQTASDADSIDTYGPKTRSLSGLLMKTDAQARSRADQIVYRYKDAQTRVDSWTVNPQAKPAQWQQHLALELGDHIELEVKPANVGTRDTMQLDLEQIAERATPSQWEMTLVGSPRDPNIGNYLTWGGTLAAQSWGTGVWA